MTLEMLQKDNVGKDKWNEFVRLSPQGSIFSTTIYLDAIGASYELLVNYNEHGIQAGIPLTRGLIGLYTNPLYCKYLGILIAPITATNTAKVSSRFINNISPIVAEIRGFRSFDYTFHPGFNNWTPLHLAGFNQRTQYSYVLPFLQKKSWLTNAATRMRNAAIKAERSGVVVECVESDKDVIDCYHICMFPFSSRGARAPLNLNKYLKMLKILGRLGIIKCWLGRNETGEPVTAAVTITDWKSSYFILNGTRGEAPTGANTLLLRTAIFDAHERKLNFDFEGSMIGPIEFYYRGFGGDLVPYHRIWKPSFINVSKNIGIKLARKLLRYNR